MRLICMLVFRLSRINHKNFCRLTLLLLTNPAIAGDLSAVSGSWQVTEVHTNSAATRTAFYVWNDPRLVGRIFSFSPDEISNDAPENLACLTPHAKVVIADPRDLIGDSMAGYGYPSKRADAEVYNLAIGAATRARVIQFYCKTVLWNGGVGASGGLQGSWIFLADANRMILRWYDETILVLRKLPSDQKINPSFDCLKSTSLTERSICHSTALSSFDRSVSEAYKLVLSKFRASDDAGKAYSLKIDQKAWLARRDGCGANKECILALTRSRLNELMAF